MKTKVVLALLLLAAGALGAESLHAPQEPAATVVVVHGLGRTHRSMAILSARLRNAGFRVVNVDYPSTSEPIESLVDHLGQEVRGCCGEGADVHFVTHSMGGVLVRGYLEERNEPFEGRVVMLSPPSRGSEVVDAFADSPLLELLVGPAALGLGTDEESVPNQLGPVDFSLGIITGDRSLDPIGSWIIPGPDDGKVSVARAYVDGADGFLVLPATHTFIMNRLDVADQVIHFLRNGAFRAEPGV